MTALKIKNQVLQLIIDTDDVEVLTKVRDFVSDMQNPNDTFTLTEEQLKQIEKSEEDIREGRVHTHEEVRARIKDFMQKKIQEAK